MAGQGEKTEKPSAKKLRDAREKGQIARSRDLGVAAGTVAAAFALNRFGGTMLRQLGDHVGSDLSRIGTSPLHDLTSADLSAIIASGLRLITVLVGPVALVAMVVGVLTFLVQSGGLVTPTALQFNWSRLSPVTGFQRLAPKQSGLDTLKAMLTAVVLAYLSWKVVSPIIDRGSALVWLTPAAAGLAGWAAVIQLLWRAAIALLALAVADYGLQWWRHYSSLKMTKQELRDESRSSEGSPEVKGRMRRLQRELSRRRMLAAVPAATLVVTNPTHFAVALDYRRDAMVAPRVVAKGRDHLAARIREAARAHGVPLVENPPLAQALYKGAEVGDTIPANLFSAVAEVMAYLIRINQLKL